MSKVFCKFFVVAAAFYFALFSNGMTGIVKAQANSAISILPCNSVPSTPGYLRSFMNWAIFNSKQKTVSVKQTEKKDSLLATVTFHSFPVKSLNDLFYVHNQSYFDGYINGTLKIVGSCRTPAFTGEISISRGNIRLSNFGEGALESVSIDTSAVANLVNRFDSLKIDMHIDFEDDFYLHNKRFLPMQIRLRGNLHFKKTINRHGQLTGKLDAIEGYIKPLGTRFQLVDGVLTYTGEIDDPKLHLSSLYIPHRQEQDVKIWYQVEGTIENPVFKFKSNPTMELKNIFSYTLFGQPFFKLNSIEQGLVSSISGRSAADRTTDVLVNRMETIATKKLSVDVVRIDNTTAESGTVITTGWYLNPRVFFAVQNIIAGKPRIGFYLEYYLRENLKLILSQDDDYGQGVDLQYEYDY